MKAANPSENKEFLKTKFCENTGIPGKRLKEELNMGYIKELCESYGVDYKNTFKPNSKYIYLKRKKKRAKP